MQKGAIKTIIEGKELPFTTVDDGIKFGEAKVAEQLRLRQENERSYQEQQIANSPQHKQDAEIYKDPEKIGVLNLTDLLKAEMNQNNIQQENLDNQKSEHVGRDDMQLEDNPYLNQEEKEDLEDKIDAKAEQMKVKTFSGKEKTEKEKNKKVKEEMSTKISQEKNSRAGNLEEKEEDIAEAKEDKSKEKDTREKKSQDLNKNEINRKEDLKSKQKGSTDREVVARYEDRVHVDDRTGQQTFKQSEISKNKNVKAGRGSFGGLTTPSNNKTGNINDTLQDAALSSKADNFMQAIATVTHTTGRTMRLELGKDTLEFKREGDNTNAYKNGQQIDPKQTRNMLKDFTVALGDKAMNRMVVLSKDQVVQNKSMDELLKTDTSKVQKTKKEKSKTKDLQI